MIRCLRLAFRKLLQEPFFAALAIGTLGIGIGAVATCFSAVNTLLFRPLPAAANGERMVYFNETRPDPLAADQVKHLGVNYLDLQDYAERSQELSALWIYTNLTVIVEDDAGPWRVLGTQISSSAFDALGVTPQLGRNFTTTDCAADATPVALISDAVWRQRFDANPEVINQIAEINGVKTRIVGVMPPLWRYPETSDIWIPFTQAESDLDKSMSTERGFFYFGAHGVLAPDATLESARAELQRIARDLALEHPQTNANVGIVLEHWRSEANTDAVYFTVLLFVAGLAIFLIACANIANLQLSRGSDRGPEIAVRLALGASRFHIIRQLVMENLVLGMLGALVGAVLGLWGVDWIRTSLEINHPFWLRFDPDWRVLAFTAFAGFMASFIFGLLPALRDSQPNVAAGLKESSRTGLDQGPFGQRLRNGIVIIEIALALVLLVGAGLMTRSFFKLTDIDPGYDARHVLTFRVGFPVNYLHDDREAVPAFFAQLPRRLEKLDGVESAGAVSQLPNTGLSLGRADLLDPASGLPPLHLDRVTYRSATAGYFASMRIPLIAGRDFATDSTQETERVIVVDQAFAAAVGLTPEELIGRHLIAPSKAEAGEDPPVSLIIGVVGSVQHFLQNIETIPTVYSAHHQDGSNFMTVTVRTTGDPAILAASIGNEVTSVNRAMPIYDVFTMEQVVRRSIWQQVFFSRLFLCAGVIAVLLACVGIYGVMTYSVTMRRHEIGLRMALGAPASEVIGEVVRKGFYLIVVGLGAGVIAATLVANLLTGTLYGITPHDPPTFIIVPALLAAVALIACYLSSWRATSIDPMTAMRAD